METRNRSQATGSTRTKTGGSAGTPGRAGRDQDANARVADTSPGDLRTGAQAEEGGLGGPGTQRTAATRGTAGLEEVPGMEEQVRRWGAGMERSGRGGYGRGMEESGEMGMGQTSMMIRESREEGDPDMQRREEDLHARQQDLGKREQSLRERDEQLRTREQNLRERQSRFAGKTGGFGATDYQDYRYRNDR